MKQKRIFPNIFLYLIAFVLMVSSVYAYASPPTVNLGTAGNFIVLAKSGISTTGTTSIVGDIGVSPNAASSITGFGLIMDGSGTFATSSLVTGKVYAADYTPPTPINMGTAISDMETAYTNAAGRPSDQTIGGDIGGLTLAPGVYTTASNLIISTDVILSGNSNSIWIFQIGGTLDISSGKKVILSGGAQAKNIFWQVAGATTLGTTSVFNGNILDQTNIAIQTGATLNGRALAQTAVTLDSHKIFSSNGNNGNNGNPAQPSYATLTVTKIVINDGGGSKTVGDFILKVNDKTVNSSQQFIFNPGRYQVTEVSDPLYKARFSGDCNSNGRIDLRAGDVKTCTITNTYMIPAMLTVTKIVINDDGGTKQVSDFTLKVNNVQVISGAQNTFSAGNYVVSEVSDPMYKASFSGDCSSSGRINLHAGDVKTCIITNNDIPPAKLTVTKIVINDDGGTKQVSDFTLKVNNVQVISGEQNTFSPGKYVVLEVSDPMYRASFSGDCSSSGRISLRAGDVKTCIITNNDIRPKNDIHPPCDYKKE
jgi:hypothetical protein